MLQAGAHHGSPTGKTGGCVQEGGIGIIGALPPEGGLPEHPGPLRCRKARTSVLVFTFALYDGKDLFAPLHETWKKHPEMSVKLFVDIHPGENGFPPASVVAKFRQDFRTHHWPWERLPEVYYDPRSLAPYPRERACLHAKCVIVDAQEVFLTSANLTEAAQQRNIEAGLVVTSPLLACKVRDQFMSLVSSGSVGLLT